MARRVQGWLATPLPHEFLFKARWRATSLTIKVPAKDYDDAVTRAERAVLRMEGGVHCMSIDYVGQTR